MLRSIKIATGALCVFSQSLVFTAPAVSADARTVGGARGDARGLAALFTPEHNIQTGDPKKDKFARLIHKAAKKHGVPVKIAKAVVEVESNFNPKARGSAGEVGLMQIKPATARGMGYRGSTKALYNPETNLEWGMKYLAGAHDRANGDLCGTILRYNAGHYAKRMNPISRRYCKKVQRILASS